MAIMLYSRPIPTSIWTPAMPAPAVRFPAEWEPQSAILLTWPHSETNWAPNLAAAEQQMQRSQAREEPYR